MGVLVMRKRRKDDGVICGSLKFQGKFFFLLWKCFHEILPTKRELVRKKVTVEASCPLCGADVETIIHLFVFCPFAQKVWSRSPLLLDFRNDQFNSFVAFWDVLGFWWQNGVNKDECFALAAMIMWFIWKGRNGSIFQNRVILPGVVSDRAVSCLREFLDANCKLAAELAVST